MEEVKTQASAESGLLAKIINTVLNNKTYLYIGVVIVLLLIIISFIYFKFIRSNKKKNKEHFNTKYAVNESGEPFPIIHEKIQQQIQEQIQQQNQQTINKEQESENDQQNVKTKQAKEEIPKLRHPGSEPQKQINTKVQVSLPINKNNEYESSSERDTTSDENENVESLNLTKEEIEELKKKIGSNFDDENVINAANDSEDEDNDEDDS
jgi:hypothetical protein